MDMHYNLGNNKFSKTYKENDIEKGWSKLFAAIYKRDWKAAAKESHRTDKELAKRNDHIFSLFYRAATEDILDTAKD